MPATNYPPSAYINRELSTLDFQLRVLDLANNCSIPLLDRLFFLIVFSSNLDEFFEIRVAGLLERVRHNDDHAVRPDGIRPSACLHKISTLTHQAIDAQYAILNDSILPALATHNIRYLKRDELSCRQSAWVKAYFFTQVLPVLTPISIDPAHPFPRLVNKSLNFIVSLDGVDAFGRDIRLAIVPAPRSLPRIIRLPDDLTDGQPHHVMLSAVIHEHIGEVFAGMTVTGCHQFRLTRNADLDLDNDVYDIAEALRGKLRERRFGHKVRLEVVQNCPTAIRDFLLTQFDLAPWQLYRVNGPVNLTRLLSDFDKATLRFPAFVQRTPRVLKDASSLFTALKAGDVLLHHPFHSFEPVVQLINEAADDPNVLAIKQTLYRSGNNSAIEQALLKAARSGKEVTAVIELRARFDEASNIELASRLQAAGAVVVYGIVGYKTHAKMLLIVRREQGQLCRYAHLSTGNYHAGNAKAYTDYGLLTANDKLTEDVHHMFMELTGLGKIAPTHHILHAPFTLCQRLLAFIDDEITHAKAGKPAKIIMKMNALTEQSVIDKLYDASKAGVQIDLIIRSICCLRPQVTDLSENIRVRSIVGRFLEHTRVYYFYNNGDERLYCASADLMERNLHHRIEIAFPILDQRLFAQIYNDGLINYLADDTFAWQLIDDTWQKIPTTVGHNAQEVLLERLT